MFAISYWHMLDTLDDYLTKKGRQIVDRLRKSMVKNNRVATGRTIKQIYSTVKAGNLKVMAPSYVVNLEKGRRPTRETGFERSNGQFLASLKQWLRARGIDESNLYPIYKKINLSGYEGTPGLISSVINQSLIDEIMKETAEIEGKDTFLIIKNIFK